MNRRTIVGCAAAASTLAGRALAQAPAPAPARPHIVLVHGSWHGGWCWDRVVPLLRAAGHPVSAPTLTGCGERQHLLSRAVTLDTHVQDVVSHLDAEELDGIVLVAHSYGGFVAAGVAERVGARIATLILLDAFAPRDGETVLDYAGPQRKAEVIAAVARDPAFNLPPPPAAAFGVTVPADAAWVDRRVTPHPVGTYLQPIRLTAGFGSVARRTYLGCDGTRMAVFDETKQRLAATPGWSYASLQTGHDAMVIAPAMLTDAIVAAAGG